MTKTILIAEDEPEILETLVFILSRAGYRVEVARTGAEAIRSVEQLPIDLVLTDYHMPLGTAREVVEKVEITKPHIPVIVMSGREIKPLNGTEAILRKPFPAERLIGTVRAALGDMPLASR